MSNKVYIESENLRLFISPQDDAPVKGKKWSHYLQLYLKEQIRRTFQEEGSLQSDHQFALFAISNRLIQNTEEYDSIKEEIQKWSNSAVVVYLFLEPISTAPFNGFAVPVFSIDPETNQQFSIQEIFELGQIQHFLSRISDVLYAISGITQYLSGQNSEDTIYLASCDDSMNSLKQLMRKEIMQKGYFVYPDLIKEEHLESILQQAILSIHLFGKHLEQTSPILESQPKFENQTASKISLLRKEKQKLNPMAKGLKRIIWIPESGTIRNEKQEQFIADLKKNPELNAGAEFYWGSIELLKEAAMEAIHSQSFNKAIITSQTNQTQFVARREQSTFKYSDTSQYQETRHLENPGDPLSNAESHSQPDAKHSDMMFWLRSSEEFRPNPKHSVLKQEKQAIVNTQPTTSLPPEKTEAKVLETNIESSTIEVKNDKSIDSETTESTYITNEESEDNSTFEIEIESTTLNLDDENPDSNIN